MAKIRFIVTDFVSHRTWIEGYQGYRVSEVTDLKDDRGWAHVHDIRTTFVPGDRWKFRMMAAAADIIEEIAMDDDILVVDAMLDVTVLVALLKSTRPLHKCPLVFVYFHENQFTTPFTGQDRDFQKQQQYQTHWHYGMAHWRSLLVADGCIFNSATHFQKFSAALPKCLKEQCPRDAVEWHLAKCKELLASKCTVLWYGLDLDELVHLQRHGNSKEDANVSPCNVSMYDHPHQRIPVVLWVARLEEDKNPSSFLELLQQTKTKSTISFHLIVLGTDPSNDRRWYNRFREQFGDMILFMGWCNDRTEYARWLSIASIVVSTANHETFGISVLEAVHCGALPLLPHRLSYPEIFPSVAQAQERYFYKNATKDGTSKLMKLLEMVATDPDAQKQAQKDVRKASNRFRWEVMKPIYDLFFENLANGETIVDAGNQVKVSLEKWGNERAYKITSCINGKGLGGASSQGIITLTITEASDPRVQLYRPKSIRDLTVYNRQRSVLRSQGIEPALHGGRRAMVRMLEAIRWGAKIQPISFLTTPDLAATVLLPAQKKNEYSAIPFAAPVYTADKVVLNDIRGQKLNMGDAILAMILFPMVSPLKELLENPPILILENVRNAENVGSILRTAFCLGVRSIVAADTAWAALKDSRAARCSMGSMYYHRYFHATDRNQKIKTNQDGLVSTIDAIRQVGIRVYGVEIGRDANPISPHGSSSHWAAVMGNEDIGLSSRVASACDQIVFIPQVHGDSLNVGHAAAIAMFELGRLGPAKTHNGLAGCT